MSSRKQPEALGSLPSSQLLDASSSQTVWTMCWPVGREVLLSHRSGSRGLANKLPAPSPLDIHLGPRPSNAGRATATVKLNGFISPQWPQFPPPPLDLSRVGALGPARGTGGPVQTTVLESGPEWVSGSPPSLPWAEGPAGQRQVDCPCLEGPQFRGFLDWSQLHLSRG